MAENTRPYSMKSALIDVLLTFLTGGLWLVWVIIRHTHRN